MSKFTKLFFAVAMLFGLLNQTLAEKYKATMVFGGDATGTSENVDAEIVEEEGGTYKITFIGFDTEVKLLGPVTSGSSSITALEGIEIDGNMTLKQTSNSKFKFAGESLTLSQFDATIDKDGNGSGSFSGGKTAVFISASATCDFTLTKVVDTDTIVTADLNYNNVPFYNKAVDMSKTSDTIKTNNDSTAIGIQLFEKKATFVMTDYEISVGELALKQRLLLEGLTYTTDEIGVTHISGSTNMFVDKYNMYVPATADLTLKPGEVIDGTIDLSVNVYTFNYQIKVILGQQAEGVVVETKVLEYEKTDKLNVKSDEAFVFDSLIYINENGILIEKIQYSIIDQEMTLLIKEYSKAAPLLDGEGEGLESPVLISAQKAEAYITVEDETIYLKDIDINLALTLTPNTNNASGSLTIVDGGPATNNFLDIDAPFAIDGFVGRNIVFYVDTTGNGLDGNTADTEFRIGGVYDYVDGEIKYVKIATDLDDVREAAIKEINENGHGFIISVVATDSAGNSTTFNTTCYAKAAPTYIEEKAAFVTNIRVVADSLTAKAVVKLDSFAVEYYAKNDSLKLSAKVNTITAKVEIEGERYDLPTTVDMAVGKHEIKYVWANPYTGEEKELTSSIVVYETESSMTKTTNVASKAVSVAYKNGELIVNGANDANVSVINLSGATVYTGKAGAINLHKGIYVVKVNGKAYKIIVK